MSAENYKLEDSIIKIVQDSRNTELAFAGYSPIKTASDRVMRSDKFEYLEINVPRHSLHPAAGFGINSSSVLSIVDILAGYNNNVYIREQTTNQCGNAKNVLDILELAILANKTLVFAFEYSEKSRAKDKRSIAKLGKKLSKLFENKEISNCYLMPVFG